MDESRTRPTLTQQELELYLQKDQQARTNDKLILANLGQPHLPVQLGQYRSLEAWRRRQRIYLSVFLMCLPLSIFSGFKGYQAILKRASINFQDPETLRRGVELGQSFNHIQYPDLHLPFDFLGLAQDLDKFHDSSNP